MTCNTVASVWRDEEEQFLNKNMVITQTYKAEITSIILSAPKLTQNVPQRQSHFNCRKHSAVNGDISPQLTSIIVNSTICAVHTED